MREDLGMELREASLEEAERMAKEIQNALLEAGDSEGAKVAFQALLAARRGDLAATKSAIARARSRNVDEG